MKTWDPDGPDAPVHGIPPGCRAVPLVEVVERNGEQVERRDRHRRQKTADVVLVADPNHPSVDVEPSLRRFALGAGRRRWNTVVTRYGDDAFEVALRLVRAGVVQLACRVDDRGTVSTLHWWQPTIVAAAAVEDERALARSRLTERDRATRSLVEELERSFPEVAKALANAQSPTAHAVVRAAANDLLSGIEHAGPRAFVQTHFGRTKAHDVRAILTAAGVPGEILERVGLRRGDRIGLGGPVIVQSEAGTVDLAPLRGPVVLRLDQPKLVVSTSASLVVVMENLQPAEIVCARRPDLAVVYTSGQFGPDTGDVLAQLGASRRVVAILDADLGGVRIARRVLQALPAATIVDVGSWPHPPQPHFPVDGVSVKGLRALADEPAVGAFASAILDRGYPVEQELATLDIVEAVLRSESPERISG